MHVELLIFFFFFIARLHVIMVDKWNVLKGL